MSLISYMDLLDLIHEGVIDADPKNVNGTSIDITLGNSIMIETVPLTLPGQDIDLKSKQVLNMKEVILSDEGYLLRPSQFILANTKEIFNLPNDVSCEYKLKSSLARSGLQHMLAGWCDPGWSNSTLTLELKNVTKYHNLLLKPGMKIGQMIFWYCHPIPEEESYKNKGQYNNQDKATNSKGVR